MKSLIVDLQILPEELARYYSGVSQVRAVTREGQRVQFPVGVLHRFITHAGIVGTFEIFFDENNKFQQVVKL